MAKGHLALVLHGHLPFVRHPEHEDSFEESWLYQAITEVYVPLLLVLDGLVADAVDFRLTFSLTPTLVSMLTDPLLQCRYLRRLDRLIELLETEVARTKPQPPRGPHRARDRGPQHARFSHAGVVGRDGAEFQSLAAMYRQQFTRIRSAFVDRYHCNLVEQFRRLQELGKLEIIASAATHGYLPLLSVSPWAVRSQIQVGIAHYIATFGRKPNGFWLPECGYYPGVDELLTDHGIRFTILETHGITRARPRPRYGVHAPLQCPSGVAVFGRDPDSSRQVWSTAEGYPGDYDYREYYRDLVHDLDPDSLERYVHPGGLRIETGIKCYRITGKTESKQAYVPEQAEKKAEIHAEHFVRARKEQIESLASVMDRKPILTAPYDAELFGHWWYEGPLWLNHVIRKIARDPSSIRLVTLSEHLAEYPDVQPASPPMSSWGRDGFNAVWLSPENDWIYPHLRQAARVMEKFEIDYSDSDPLTTRALHQAKRELLLAQSSDWAFMMSARTTVEYAKCRTKSHLLNFSRLTGQIAHGDIDVDWLAQIESQNCIFPSHVLRADSEVRLPHGTRTKTSRRDSRLSKDDQPRRSDRRIV